MNEYAGFAQVYDRLMEEAPYQEWFDWVTRLFENKSDPPSVILDAGCGTGTLLKLLLKEGYDAHGLDLSRPMLAAAEEKLNTLGYYPSLYHQDMRNLCHTGVYEAIFSICDSLNYLTEEKDIETAFQEFYNHLENGGMLVFDVHSLFYVENVLHDFSFADAAVDVSYIWNAIPGKKMGEIEHELSFFIKESEGTYSRHDETHRQRTFPVSVYQSLLERTGFEVIGIYADFSFDEPDGEADRIFFHAEKRVQTNENEVNL